MALAGQDGEVGIPCVGVANRTLAIKRRHLLPQGSGTGAAAVADMQGNNFARVAIHRQPNPDFVSSLTDVAPDFIALKRQTRFFLIGPWLAVVGRHITH